MSNPPPQTQSQPDQYYSSPKLKEHPCSTIRRIMDIIPWKELEENHEKGLRHDLEYLLTDCAYRAPEQYSDNINKLGTDLGRHLGEPDTEWKKEIGTIMQNLCKKTS